MTQSKYHGYFETKYKFPWVSFLTERSTLHFACHPQQGIVGSSCHFISDLLPSFNIILYEFRNLCPTPSGLCPFLTVHYLMQSSS